MLVRTIRAKRQNNRGKTTAQDALQEACRTKDGSLYLGKIEK